MKTTRPMSETKYYLALDIESRGRSFANPVTAIGLYLGPVDPDTPHARREKKRWALQPLAGQVDEERCITEFWVLT